MDVAATVRDFEAFCSYILENGIPLTARGGLGKKACFEMNALMTYPVPDAKITNLMSKYPSIILYLTIALKAGLLDPGLVVGQKSGMTATDDYAAYKEMNKYSKHLFIFLAWMKYIDADKIYGDVMPIRWSYPFLIEQSLDQIGDIHKPGAIIKRKGLGKYNRNEESFQCAMNECVLLLHHYRDLGLVGYNDGNLDKNNYNRTVLNEAWVTEIGAALSAACTARRFTWINVYENDCLFNLDREVELYENDFKINPPGSEGFLLPFAACYPENEIDVNAINQLLFDDPESTPADAAYKFRVSLSRNCYREILCGACDTFEDLHLSIQQAFEFDNDHLYAFFLDGKRWSRHMINAPLCDEPPFACDVLIGEAGLRVKQNILYLFDFGDEWKFNVTLLSIDDGEEVPESPIITKSVGKPPEQYPSYDD